MKPNELTTMYFASLTQMVVRAAETKHMGYPNDIKHNHKNLALW